MVRGERILNWLEDAFARKTSSVTSPAASKPFSLDVAAEQIPLPVLPGLEFTRPGSGWETVDLFGVARAPVPYHVFRARLAEANRSGDQPACA